MFCVRDFIFGNNSVFQISEEIGESMNKTVQTLYKFNGDDETTKAFDFTQTEVGHSDPETIRSTDSK